MTRQDPACWQGALVDRHFCAGLLPEREAGLRAHLAGCLACRQRYDRHLLYGRLTHRGRSPAERLAAGLGLLPASPRRRGETAQRRLAAGVAVACAAGFALFAGRWVPERSEKIRLADVSQEAGFVARGEQWAEETAPKASLEVYRLPENGVPAPLGRVFGASDGLAFAYRNPAGFARLLVFGVEENRRVYWFHPPWLDPRENPIAVAIEPGDEARELPIVIRHDYAGLDLHLVALFTDRALSVREVEAAVARGSLELPGTYRLEWDLEIAP